MYVETVVKFTMIKGFLELSIQHMSTKQAHANRNSELLNV